jgi:hypothetical protein
VPEQDGRRIGRRVARAPPVAAGFLAEQYFGLLEGADVVEVAG